MTGPAAGTGAIRTGLAVLGLAFLIAFALPVQELGCTQTSQLALTRALAAGTARIDRWQETTCDKAWFQGHYYSVKAPGLAASALPAFLALRALDLLPASATTTIWLLNLLTVVPAVLLLVFLTWRVAEWVAPGSGVLAAVALGIGSLALPFGTLWFGHVPAAALGFAAFTLLLRARLTSAGRRLDAAAGFLAGAAILFEYPLALLAAALLVYAVATRGARSAGIFAAAAAVPALGLLAYNAWAFGSVTHLSYEDAVTVTGNSGHDVIGANSQGFFGITWPSPHALAELLVSPRGLLTLTPICLLGALGIVALRKRAPTEAALAGAIVAAFLVYNAGYTLSFGGPFGGDSPGTRFLIAVLPFLVFPVGLAARRYPGAAAAMIGVSAATMIASTATVPMVGEGETHRWLDGLRNGEFTHTVVTLLGGGSRWPAVLPFAVVTLALAALGVRTAYRLSTSRARAAFEAGCALVAWLLLLIASSRLFDAQRATGLIALAFAAAAATAALLAGHRAGEGAVETPSEVRKG